MAKRGRPPKKPLPPIPWYKKAWVKIVAIATPIVYILGFIINFLSASADVPSGVENWFSWTGYSLEKIEKGSTKNCTFPKKFQKDTLYVLVARFEDNITTIESECYGNSLRARIDNIAHQRKIPIQVCYNEKIVINTIDEAKRVQKEYNADVVFYGTIRNIEKSCMAGDVCFKNQLSDTLIHLAGGKLKVEDIKYEKELSPEKIEIGEFHINEKRFDTWLFTYYNVKIGRFNPDLYLIDEKMPHKELAKEYLEKAKLYFNFGKDVECIKNCNVSIQLDNNNAQTYSFRGISKSRLSDNQEAIKDFDEAIKLNPKYAEAYRNRGFTKYDLGKYQESIKDSDKAIELNPKDAVTYYNRGFTKQKLGQYKGAIRDYDKAIELNSKFKEAYTNRGVSKKYLENYKEAIEDYNKAIELNPKYAVAYHNRASSKICIGQYQEAIKDCDKAIELDPKLVFAYIKRGDSNFNLGQYQEAIKDYDKTIELNPKEVGAYNNRGIAKYNMGKPHEAFKDYNKAIELNPKYAEAYNNRGTLKYDLEQYQEAIEDYDKAIKLNPRVAVAYSNRGFLKEILGKKAEAEKDFKKAKALGYKL